MTTVTLNTELPWSSTEKDNQRFNRITTAALVVTLLMAGVVKLYTVPEIPRAEKEKLPPQLARLITKPQPPKIEPKPEPKVEPKKEPEKKVEEKALAKPEIKPKPKPKPVEVAEPKPVQQKQTTEQAREKASQSGLLALSDELMGMREQTSVNRAANSQTIEGAGQSKVTQRKTISSQAVTQTSGGVANAEVSSNIGSRGSLEDRQTTQLSAPTEGAAKLAAKQVEVESEVIGNRDLESIRKILDANKGAVYALYRRALRQAPDLQGKVTFKLTIEPSGQISAISIVSSELNNPDLEAKLRARVSMINFGNEAVTQTELEYAFNFLPY
ncbi:alcohol dehydrogenase [Alteromonas aestuariivivens]|uniref:Alcohol dehydrogenase n=1 Tax=Alteromonas aestuariivivens TaxID=1938339 RepID=A0A3D8MD75_9ALTE|nr:AgmX/PglI C-terminal domain-containing protein [Alteromonas aestuariivivens]RDV28189.1 alcohol dehydrogenase [Alteromonas aestuariivivens]